MSSSEKSFTSPPVLLTNVFSGVSWGKPVNAVRGHRFPRRSIIVLFKTDCTTGKTLGQEPFGSWYYGKSARVALRSSRQMTSTILLDHGQYESVKWCDDFFFPCMALISSFLKWLPRSVIHWCTVPKFSNHRIRISAALSAVVSLVAVSQTYPLWSSLSIKTYLNTDSP